MPCVTIFYKTLPSYRLEFFCGLREALAEDGVELRLIYGNPYGREALKGDSRALPWARYRPNRFVALRGRHAIWQPVLDLVRGSDLIIVEQASRLLVNYPLLAMSVTGLGPKLAFWGHGANLQAHTASRISEIAKRRYSRLPHWWFAYTEGTKRRVVALGYPKERVTVVQNAIDTVALRRAIQQTGPLQVDHFLERFRAQRGHVGVFVGSLYADKRLSFLIEAAGYARQYDPAFTLFIAGDGPGRAVVDEAAADYSFIHALGRVDGNERALLLASSDVMLMPGLVGLAILDAFAAETPLITQDLPFHSPEIEYLTPGAEGLMLPGVGPEEYGRAVAELLEDRDQLELMRSRCRDAASRLTVEEMVGRFRQGILEALDAE